MKLLKSSISDVKDRFIFFISIKNVAPVNTIQYEKGKRNAVQKIFGLLNEIIKDHSAV